MAVGAIARVLLGLAVKGLKKSKPKKVVKKPKSAKATKTSAADDAKAKKTEVSGRGTTLRKRKRLSTKKSITPTQAGGRKVYNTVATRSPKSVRTKARVTERFAGSMHRNIPKGSPKITDMKNVGKAKRRGSSTVSAKDVAVAAVAAGGAYTAGKVRGPAGKTVKVKGGTKPVRWRNSKRVGRTKVASKLRTEYNPKTDQWIKHTD